MKVEELARALVITQLHFINGLGVSRPLPRQAPMSSFWPINLSIDSLTTGPDDWDIPSNEIYCPCDAKLPWPSGTVGDAYRIGTQHLGQVHGKW